MNFLTRIINKIFPRKSIHQIVKDIEDELQETNDLILHVAETSATRSEITVIHNAILGIDNRIHVLEQLITQHHKILDDITEEAKETQEFEESEKIIH